MATELLINIVSQATGKGFLESEKSVKKLQKNVKTLGKTFGVTFAVGAVVAFGKAAVKAFSEDEKAANRLSRAVENLGIGFANPAISKFIADLEKTSAIADDILRPAFQNLLTTTGSLTKSQELLNNAITISRASGVDLTTVTNDLAKAYVGSNKGLAKYSTGLTRAEIESKSFSEVLGVLLKQSAGAAEDYLSSTAYQMEVLSIAGGNASEIIGGGLVDAFAMIAGGTEASDAAKGIEIVATGVANLARATGAAVTGIPTLLRALKNLPKNIFGGFAGVSAGININTPAETNKLTASQKKQKEAMARLEKAALARAKQLADLAKKQAAAELAKTKEKEKQAKLDEAALKLDKGENVFDLDKIQVAAALLAKQEEINKLGVNATDQQKLQLANELTRLSIKQTMAQLEDAITAKNVNAATAAASRLNFELGILGALQNQNFSLINLNAVIDKIQPKNIIDIKNLNDALELLAKMAGITIDPLKLAAGTTVGPSTAITTMPITTPSVTAIDTNTAALAAAATDATSATTALGQAVTQAITDLAIAKIEAGEAAITAAEAQLTAAEAAAKSAAADALLASAAAEALSASSDAATKTLASATATVEGSNAALGLTTDAATKTLASATATVEGSNAALGLASDAATKTLGAANETVTATIAALNVITALAQNANTAKIEAQAAQEGARAAAAAAEAAALAAEAAADYLRITQSISANSNSVSNNATNITVNVNAGVIGNEDTVSTAVQNAILDLQNKGDSLLAAGLIE